MNNIGTKNIETKRLILRKFTEDDAKEIYEGYANQERFLYYANKGRRTLEEEIESLKGIDEKYNNLEYYNWLITLKVCNHSVLQDLMNTFKNEHIISGCKTICLPDSLIIVIRFLYKGVRISALYTCQS